MELGLLAGNRRPFRSGVGLLSLAWDWQKARRGDFPVACWL